MTQKLEVRACFMQNFMEFDKKKLLDTKAVTFGVWGLKTSLGQLGAKRCIKPVWNPGSNFNKQDLTFSRIAI